MVSQVREVKEATDIVSVLGQRVTLQRSGRNYRGLCPFHGEKSPSFFVSPELQVYRCFGCGERGDVFTFLEKFEGLTFSESLKMLAEQAGISLHSFTPTQEDNQREKVLEILELSKQYYHYLLTEHELGSVAQEYLKQRQTTNESIKLFQLGYSLQSWDGLIKYLVKKKKYQISDLETAGLVILRNTAKKGSTDPYDYYDRFRGRLMFPLRDHRSRVVGFSGRVLDSNTKEAKYINSPETVVYHKSKLLFGFSQQYREIREAKQVVIVEGEFDVISSSQAFVRNVVAIKGSAMTKEHVELLSRTVETVILSLDADAAGVEATKKAIALTQAAGLRVRVLSTDEVAGKDPDDFARTNPSGWREHVKKSISAYQFLIDVACKKFDAQTGEGKRQIMLELAGIINSIELAVEKAHYITVLANKLGVSESIIQQDLTRSYQKSELPKHATAQETESAEVLSPDEQIQKLVLFLLLQLSDRNLPQLLEKIPVNYFTHTSYRQIRELIEKQKDHFTIKQFAKTLPSELTQVFSNVYLLQQREDVPSMKEFDGAVTRLHQLYVKQRMQSVTQEIKLLENKEQLTQEDEARYTHLIQESAQLNSSLKSTFTHA